MAFQVLPDGLAGHFLQGAALMLGTQTQRPGLSDAPGARWRHVAREVGLDDLAAEIARLKDLALNECEDPLLVDPARGAGTNAARKLR